MARSRMNKPSVATYADHEVFTPPNKLRKVMSVVAEPEAGTEDAVARAEQALSQLSSQFAAWMEAECERLDQARNAVKDGGFTKKARDRLFFAAHDIKGDAETFGYQMAAIPADSLCRLIEHTPDPSRIPVTLLDQHVDAIRAIVRETARPDAQETATALTRRLCEVTDEFLAHENRDRPDELKDILAPALAPGDPGF
jgi:HPt (histidine-containing phosphotransfer) domain-containing protein